jgi:CubicO group peptidase (beta-lactamase class C family)
MLDYLSHYTLKRDIGSAYEYSNFGAGLLGYALSYAAKKPYEALVMERICGPLGMKDTRVVLSREQQARLAPGSAGGRPAANWTFDAMAGAGALRSTTEDLLRYVSANLGLQKSALDATLQTTHEGRYETGRPELFVALGWHVSTAHGTTIFWHNGQTGGYHSFCGFRPDQNLGVVVLANSTDDIDDIGRHILDSQTPLPTLRETARSPVPHWRTTSAVRAGAGRRISHYA